MKPDNKIRAEVAGTGIFLPSKVLTNEDLEKTLDTSDEWIRTRTGIRERRIAGENESSSTLAIEAAKMALESAKISAEELDLIIVCTSTPDILFLLPLVLCKKELVLPMLPPMIFLRYVQGLFLVYLLESSISRVVGIVMF